MDRLKRKGIMCLTLFGRDHIHMSNSRRSSLWRSYKATIVLLLFVIAERGEGTTRTVPLASPTTPMEYACGGKTFMYGDLNSHHFPNEANPQVQFERWSNICKSAHVLAWNAPPRHAPETPHEIRMKMASGLMLRGLKGFNRVLLMRKDDGTHVVVAFADVEIDASTNSLVVDAFVTGKVFDSEIPEGCGRAMVVGWIEEAYGKHVQSISLTSAVSAVGFYVKCGFQQRKGWGEQHLRLSFPSEEAKNDAIGHVCGPLVVDATSAAEERARGAATSPSESLLVPPVGSGGTQTGLVGHLQQRSPQESTVAGVE